MKVLKFGGTSVGSAERIMEVAKLINDGDKKIVVLSAMSGSTNSLVEISNLLKSKQGKLASDKINTLKQKYDTTVKKLLTTEEYTAKGQVLIEEKFAHLHSFEEKECGLKEANDILAQGELISTTLMTYHLSEIGVKNALLPALDYMKTDHKSEPDMDYITKNVKIELDKHPEAEIFITQGFICKNIDGEIDNLHRGGSDYTATIVGAAVLATEIQIWTDIDGMHNNDPRYVDDTKPIAQLSYNEAAELAYFGAKILHPTCVRPAKDSSIPVRLLNTMEPTAEGTRISNIETKGRVVAIAAKDDITAIKIKSGRMLLAHGFLRKIFEIFEEYKTAIDMITTSEVGVSLTIDDDTNLKEIVRELEDLGAVTVDPNQVIVCIAGDFSPKNLEFIAKVTEALKEMPVRMISYGGSNHNISLLIEESYRKEALNLLSSNLFNEQSS